MLAIDGVDVRYGNVAALTDVSLEVTEGTLHGVLGPNGAGKSTLMNVLCGAQRPTRGSVVYDGVDIGRKPARWRRRRGLSRSFQKTSIFPALTIREQLDLVSRGKREQVEESAEVLGLTSILDRRADTVSYGDQRRVDIALAVVGDARVLLLDEPAAGLTVQETAELFAHVATLVREKGLTALVVEHDVDAIFRSCDVVTVLDLGQVVMTDTPDRVRGDQRVITAYLGSSA